MAEQKENKLERKIIPFYALRLRNLITAKASLRVQCRFCATESELDVVALVWKLGPDADIRGIEKRLRCQKCRERGHSFLSLTWF
jgi:hypothetical protein